MEEEKGFSQVDGQKRRDVEGKAKIGAEKALLQGFGRSKGDSIRGTSCHFGKAGKIKECMHLDSLRNSWFDMCTHRNFQHLFRASGCTAGIACSNCLLLNYV